VIAPMPSEKKPMNTHSSTTSTHAGHAREKHTPTSSRLTPPPTELGLEEGTQKEKGGYGEGKRGGRAFTHGHA
jgi:hypothetical protein